MNEPQGANKMKIFTVSIFGHWQFGDFFMSEKLEKGIRELLITKEYLEFGVGVMVNFIDLRLQLSSDASELSETI